MKKIRVLIVDDSVVFRSQIRAALESVAWIDVVGVAAHGRIAIDKLKSTEVDLITLDLEMPELNGIETLREIRNLGIKVKTIVFAASSKKGARVTFEALELGAADFVPKPGGESHLQAEGHSSLDLLRSILIPKIEVLFQGQLSAGPSPLPNSPAAGQPRQAYPWKSFQPKAIVIGSSTGGPTALEYIFSKLHGPFRCPVFIAQHMPPVFTASLAGRLSNLCGVPAAEGLHGKAITENYIYVAPGNYHMQVVRQNNALQISLNQEEQENSVRPAVDQLFRSAALVYRQNCLGLILTGMGKDGLIGCQHLQKTGNPIIIQNRESCVVFGMPGAVYDAAAYDSIQDLDQIAETLRNYLEGALPMSKGVA